MESDKEPRAIFIVDTVFVKESSIAQVLADEMPCGCPVVVTIGIGRITNAMEYLEVYYYSKIKSCSNKYELLVIRG